MTLLFLKKNKIAVICILLLTSCHSQAQFLLDAGSSLAILGNHEPIRPVISIGYSPRYFSSPVGIIYTKVIGKKRTSIVALNFYFNKLCGKVFFLPGAGYMINKTPYLNSHFQFYWTLGYRINKSYYIAYKHVSNGSKLFKFMPSPNRGENMIILGAIF